MSSRNLRPLRPVSRTRRVFTDRQPRRQPSIGRQFWEGVLLLALSAGTLAFLSWLPQKNEGLLVVSEAIADLIGGIKVMLDAFTAGEIDRLYIISNDFVNTKPLQLDDLMLISRALFNNYNIC